MLAILRIPAEKLPRVFHMYRRDHRHQLSFCGFLPALSRVALRRDLFSWPAPEVGAFYWTAVAPDIVNLGREKLGSVSLET